MSVPSSNEGVVASIEELVLLRFKAANIFRSSEKKTAAPIAGGYASPYRGRGIDFSEVRQYQPGDDIRTMDWRVTARTGKPHTKLFVEERERPVFFMVDFRQTMLFGTRVCFKSVLAARIASLLAWAASGHGDRVGGIFFNEQEKRIIKPAGGKRGVLSLLQTASQWTELSKPNFSAEHEGVMPLREARMLIRPGSLVYILSDFKNFSSSEKSELGFLARHADIVALHLYDPIESAPPSVGVLGLSDGKDFGRIDTSSKKIQQKICGEFEARTSDFFSFCIKHGIHPLSIATNEEYVHSLRIGLARRQDLTSVERS